MKPVPYFGFTSAAAIALAVGAMVANATAADGAKSEWVYPGADGKLVYKTTPAGDRIMDFSHAGYMGGGVALPNVAVKALVKPTGQADDTAAILDTVSPGENLKAAVVPTGPGR